MRSLFASCIFIRTNKDDDDDDDDDDGDDDDDDDDDNKQRPLIDILNDYSARAELCDLCCLTVCLSVGLSVIL